MEHASKKIKVEDALSNNLPNEMWNLILRLLDRNDLKNFTLTCKTWKFIISESLQQLDFSDFRYTFF
jgi:hypothetical protein